jgi:hypothetical protein
MLEFRNLSKGLGSIHWVPALDLRKSKTIKEIEQQNEPRNTLLLDTLRLGSEARLEWRAYMDLGSKASILASIMWMTRQQL